MYKVIARARYVLFGEYNGAPLWRYECYVDPDAPHIEEIIEVLREVGGALSVDYHGQDVELIDRIDSLINKLEG